MYRSYYYYGINTISITYYILLFIYIIIIGYIYVSTTYSNTTITKHYHYNSTTVQARLAKKRIFFGQHLSRDYWPPGHENPAMRLVVLVGCSTTTTTSSSHAAPSSSVALIHSARRVPRGETRRAEWWDDQLSFPLCSFRFEGSSPTSTALGQKRRRPPPGPIINKLWVIKVFSSLLYDYFWCPIGLEVMTSRLHREGHRFDPCIRYSFQ